LITRNKCFEEIKESPSSFLNNIQDRRKERISDIYFQVFSTYISVSNEPANKDEDSRFTTVPLKPLSDQCRCGRFNILSEKSLILLILTFSCSRNAQAY